MRKTKPKRIIGGIDYMYDVDSSGNVVGKSKREVSFR
jgi:hypothetical protein